MNPPLAPSCGAHANVHHSFRVAADVAVVVRARDTTDKAAASFGRCSDLERPGRTATHRHVAKLPGSVSQRGSHTPNVPPDAPIKHRNESKVRGRTHRDEDR